MTLTCTSDGCVNEGVEIPIDESLVAEAIYCGGCGVLLSGVADRPEESAVFPDVEPEPPSNE